MTSAASQPATLAPAPRVSLFWQVIAVGLAIGLTARVVTHVVGPSYAYLPDHVDNMAWSQYAYDNGPLNIYDMRPEYAPVNVAGVDKLGLPQLRPAVAPHACNYPPGSAYIFWFQGALFHALEQRVQEVPAPPSMHARMRELGLPLTFQVRPVNTQLSRAVNGLPGFVFDLLLALGVMRLVRLIRRDRLAPLLSAVGFSLTFAAPPVFLDSAFWNQADSWITALLVWSLVWMLRDRFVIAGAVFGLACTIKPQAILMGPVLVFVFLALWRRPGGSLRASLSRMASLGATALGAICLIAIPFMISDASAPQNEHGAWRWFERSYAGTIGAAAYTRTTMNAFNLWWLDYLRQGPPTSGRQAQQFVDSTATLAGLTKARLGTLLLGSVVLLAGWLCARKWRWGPVSWVALAYLVTLAAFTLPTSVHERYIYYCIPFCIALALRSWVWAPALLFLLVVGTFEMFSFMWVSTTPENRLQTGALAIGVTLTLCYSLALLVRRADLADENEGIRPAGL